MRTTPAMATGWTCLLAAVPARALTVHVPGDQPTIQQGIDVAGEGDSVQVAPGTYFEHQLDFRGKGIVVRSSDPFDSLIVSTTVIDGDSTATVLTFHSGEGSSSILEGLTIRGGRGGLPQDPMSAGGITCREGASPTIRRCVVVDCVSESAGGGIGGWESAARIESCTIQSCYAELYGGGLSANGGAMLVTLSSITNCASGYVGGGLYCTGQSTIELTGSRVSGNTSPTDGGGAYVHSASPSIADSRFEGNSAAVGGGLWLGFSSSTIRDCELSGNFASNTGGGAHFATESRDLFYDSVIHDNSATVYGGGLFCGSTARTHMASLDLRDNYADEGGAIYFYQSRAYLLNSILTDNESGWDGGAIRMRQSSPNIGFCTIAYNTTLGFNRAGGISCRDHSSPIIESTILWGNRPRDINRILYSGPRLDYCNVEEGWDGGMGNISADPLFLTYRSRDFVLGPGSPCIDAGNPLWSDRIYDSIPWWPPFHQDGPRSDMGAYGGPLNFRWVWEDR